MNSLISHFRVATLNIGGGTKQYEGQAESMTPEKRRKMGILISQLNVDILCIQELAQYIDAEGKLHSMTENIRSDCDYPYYLYGETLSMKRHMQVKQMKMVDGLFNDWWDWSKGNAVFSRFQFSRLGDETKEGTPRNIPIFQPLSYEGNRDTDPRYVILSRIKQPPYPYIVNLHLTTLVGERGPSAWSDIVDAARLTRQQQLDRVLTLVQQNIIDQGLPLILMGDFNAKPDEYTIKDYLIKEMGFVRLEPKKDISTHPIAGMVDHIFFSPADRLISYECWIDDQQLAHQVSDHLPVIAEITFR